MFNFIKNLFRRQKTVVEMEDGTIYVANSPKNGKPMYAMPYDLDGWYTWGDAKTAAAQQSFAGHTDWRLPTKEELNVLYRVQGPIGSFRSDWYWSSTEYNTTDAWFQHFGDGCRGANYQTCQLRVRCVRSS